jgi:hypothetical protein
VAANPPIYGAAEFNVRNRPRQNGDIHVQEAQNAVMLEQDRLMDRIKAGEEALDCSDDDIICAHLTANVYTVGYGWVGSRRSEVVYNSICRLACLHTQPQGHGDAVSDLCKRRRLESSVDAVDAKVTFIAGFLFVSSLMPCCNEASMRSQLFNAISYQREWHSQLKPTDVQTS